jgi:hypothetical protein
VSRFTTASIVAQRMALQLIGLALVMAFPQIALWLPRVAR